MIFIFDLVMQTYTEITYKSMGEDDNRRGGLRQVIDNISHKGTKNTKKFQLAIMALCPSCLCGKPQLLKLEYFTIGFGNLQNPPNLINKPKQ
jgi:hypothetical protein